MPHESTGTAGPQAADSELPTRLEDVEFSARLDRWARVILLSSILLLGAAHAIYLSLSRIPPSTDEAHYMSGALSIADGVRGGTLSSVWNGYKNALGFKAPLICVPAAIFMLLTGGLVLPSMFSLLLVFVGLGFAAFSLFRHCFRPFHAAAATIVLITMPMVTGLTHRFYPELLLLLLTVAYLDLLARRCWNSPALSVAAGATMGLGVLCKITFPGLVALPTAFSVYFAATRNGLELQPNAWRRLAPNLGIAGGTALLIAAPWYAFNLPAVLDHSRLALAADSCYYLHWIWADLSAGPSLVVALIALLGLPLMMGRFLLRRETPRQTEAWILLLSMGLMTAVAVAFSVNKATRFSVTCLPAFAALAVAACRYFDRGQWGRLSFLSLGTWCGLLFIQNSFGILPVPAIRIGDARLFDSRFPLNVPGWFDDNHPVDRRDFRLSEAEALIAADVAESFAPGQTAHARTTHLGLLLNHDYFRLLAAAHKRPIDYTWWPGATTSGVDTPDYIISFQGFGHVYPGVHFFDYYPNIADDVRLKRVPYTTLTQLDGPDQTRIMIFRKNKIVSVGGKAGQADIILEAEGFQRGNVTVDSNQYGLNIGVIVTLQPAAFAEYTIDIPESRQYQIELRYASATPRPITVRLDSTVISTRAAEDSTGGFNPADQRWAPVAVVSLSAGTHTLRLESASVFPHIDQILFAPVSN